MIKMVEEKRYDKYYSTYVCPYCNHSNMIDKPKGFFDWSMTQYRCSRCSREFTSKHPLIVVPKDEVRRLVQEGLNKKITAIEMIKGFKEIGIYLYKVPHQRQSR